MAKERVKIVVQVRDGVVDDVFCNVPADFSIVDYDLLEDSDYDTVKGCAGGLGGRPCELGVSKALKEFQDEAKKVLAELKEELTREQQ